VYLVAGCQQVGGGLLTSGGQVTGEAGQIHLLILKENTNYYYNPVLKGKRNFFRLSL
jgi:hypothetical protein